MTRARGGIPRYRPWDGPALLSAGFRPFFLMMGLTAAIELPLWLAVVGGHLHLPTAFDPLIWHGHEMLFGVVQAAIAGFLFTAVPNWTGQMPIQGWSLATLAVLFLAGRVAVSASAEIGAAPAALIDLAFPAMLTAALAREIVTGRNWRNLPMIGALAMITLANGLTHVEALGWGQTGAVGLRLGIAVVLLLIALIGGRVIPSFTRNWLAKRGAQSLPAPAGRFDSVVMGMTAVALLAWVVDPGATFVALAMALAAALNFVRLARWKGHRTLAEPLVWILHLAFLWLPVGLLLTALVPATVIDPSTALHALTGGAIATMIVAVSSRAILGHTGRRLHAGGSVLAIYLFITVAALARVGAGFAEEGYMTFLSIAGVAWTSAFGLFVIVYGPMLLGPRVGR